MRWLVFWWTTNNWILSIQDFEFESRALKTFYKLCSLSLCFSYLDNSLSAVSKPKQKKTWRLSIGHCWFWLKLPFLSGMLWKCEWLHFHFHAQLKQLPLLQACCDTAFEYAHQRRQFGTRIGQLKLTLHTQLKNITDTDANNIILHVSRAYFSYHILNVCLYHLILNSIWFNQPPHILNSDLWSSILHYIGFERTNCLIKPGSMRITGQQSQFHFEFETGEMFSKQIHTILQLYNSFGLGFLWFCHFYTISGEFQLIQAKMANMHATLSACRSLAIFNTAHKNIS